MNALVDDTPADPLASEVHQGVIVVIDDIVESPIDWIKWGFEIQPGETGVVPIETAVQAKAQIEVIGV